LETLAAHHAVAPIVYRAIELRAAGAVPRGVLRRLWLGDRADAIRNPAGAGLTGAPGRRPSAGPLTGILLKGAVLVRTLYGDPGLRHVGDVDLLVDERDVPRTGSLLDAMGFRRVGRPLRTEWPTCEFQLAYDRDGQGSIPVELHWRLFGGYLPDLFDLSEGKARGGHVTGVPPGRLPVSAGHRLADPC